MRTTAFLTIVLAMMILSGDEIKPQPHFYPDSEKVKFLDGCTTSGAIEYSRCKCMYDLLKYFYTYEEYKALAQRVRENKLTERDESFDRNHGPLQR